ncbi:MAG: ABC transporter permease [Gammaproteobacteria bacterium]|nr:ABC transporter permease [Gammaproteobacteria bacterium]
MMSKPALHFSAHEPSAVAEISGDWVLRHVEQLESLSQDAGRSARQPGTLDLHALQRLDTTGALLLLQLLGMPRPEALPQKLNRVSEAHRMILTALAAAICDGDRSRKPADRWLQDLLQRIGMWVVDAAQQLKLLTHFIGVVITTTIRNLLQPWRLRWTSLVFHMEHVGLDAVPIVALLSFLVGSTVAFLGASVLRDFGATIYTPDMVSYAFLREFGTLLPAILLAGRSGSAFTAQIGSMKSNEEIDALKTLGMDPVCVLVMPRVVALLFTLPLLSFIGMLSGLLGGMLVSALVLDISPAAYASRIYNFTDIQHFWVGISKAPVFAFLIGVVGCLEGFKVSGSAESVGQHTTSSVVQSIFLVLTTDAMFAVLFEQLGL